MAGVIDRLSYVLVPCALGLVVGMVALLCYQHLMRRIEVFVMQMESASLQLVNDLARLQTQP